MDISKNCIIILSIFVSFACQNGIYEDLSSGDKISAEASDASEKQELDPEFLDLLKSYLLESEYEELLYAFNYVLTEDDRVALVQFAKDFMAVWRKFQTVTNEKELEALVKELMDMLNELGDRLNIVIEDKYGV